MTVVRLRPDIKVSTVDEGLLVAGRRRAFLISGPPLLSALWERAGSLLEQGVTVADLPALLPDGWSAPAVKLIDRLRAGGAVFDVSREFQENHPGALAALDFDRPEDAFARLQVMKVAVVGESDGARLLTESVRRMGLPNISTVDNADLVITVDLFRPPDDRPCLGVLLTGERGYVSPVGGLVEMLDRSHSDIVPRSTPDAVARLAAAVATLSVLEFGGEGGSRLSTLAHIVHRQGLRVTRHSLGTGFDQLTDPWFGLLTEPLVGDLPAMIGCAAAREKPVRYAGGDTVGAARRNALANAAKDLVGAQGLRVAVGETPDAMLRDAVRRSAVERRGRFGPLTIAVVTEHGRTVAAWADPDPLAAGRRARTHAALRAVMPEVDDPVPVLLDDTQSWEAEPLLRRLGVAVEPCLELSWPCLGLLREEA